MAPRRWPNGRPLSSSAQGCKGILPQGGGVPAAAVPVGSTGHAAARGARQWCATGRPCSWARCTLVRIGPSAPRPHRGEPRGSPSANGGSRSRPVVRPRHPRSSTASRIASSAGRMRTGRSRPAVPVRASGGRASAGRGPDRPPPAHGRQASRTWTGQPRPPIAIRSKRQRSATRSGRARRKHSAAWTIRDRCRGPRAPSAACGCTRRFTSTNSNRSPRLATRSISPHGHDQRRARMVKPWSRNSQAASHSAARPRRKAAWPVRARPAGPREAAETATDPADFHPPGRPFTARSSPSIGLSWAWLPFPARSPHPPSSRQRPPRLGRNGSPEPPGAALVCRPRAGMRARPGPCDLATTPGLRADRPRPPARAARRAPLENRHGRTLRSRPAAYRPTARLVAGRRRGTACRIGRGGLPGRPLGRAGRVASFRRRSYRP